MAGCLTTAGVLCVGFGAFISGNKVLAQNMMHARTSKTSWLSPRPAAPEASSSARSCSRLPRALASLRQSAAWVSLAGYIGLVFRRRRARVAAQFATIVVMGAATKYSLDSDATAAAAAEATKMKATVPGPAVV